MEGLKGQTPFAGFVAEHLGDRLFTVIDIGCSSGLDDAWRIFGGKLRAYGFDPNVEDVRRLSEQETLPGVKYVAAFVGVPPGTPEFTRMRNRQFTAKSPWERLSAHRTVQLRVATKELGNQEKTDLNLWTDVPLADQVKPVILTAFLQENGVDDIDFIKIDVDGADFLILRSLEQALRKSNVLGVGIEVNFHGSDQPDVHTFHNVDRFMKHNGFELFLLSTRPYSVAALPAPYQLTMPAQTEWGRVFQGDAVYFRDAASPLESAWAEKAGAAKLLKLAALFSLTGLTDCAAEVLVRFRTHLESLIDVDAGLNILTSEAAPKEQPPPSYAQYIRDFENEHPRFWPLLHPAMQVPQEPSHELAQSKKEIEELRAQLDAITSSNSWRMTLPLRNAGSRLRRVLRRQ